MSLIEMLAAVAISLIVATAGFTLLTASEKSTRVNSLIVETQDNARVAMELVSRDIRMAGFGMTGPVGACTVGGFPAAIVPTDVAGADTAPDSVALVLPITNFNPALGDVWQLTQAETGPFTFITLTPNAVTDMGVVVGSVISIGGALSSTILLVNQPAAGQLTLANPIGAPRSFPIGTQVFVLQCTTYSVGPAAGACGGTAPCLLRDGVPLVDGIEDLQIAYACDGCNGLVNGGNPDGILDDQDAGLNNSFGAEDFIPNLPTSTVAWNLPPLTPDKIKMVQINIVARQPQPDTGVSSETNFRGTNFTGPTQILDHDISTIAGFDPSDRRRILTRTVVPRNLGL